MTLDPEDLGLAIDTSLASMGRAPATAALAAALRASQGVLDERRR